MRSELSQCVYASVLLLACSRMRHDGAGRSPVLQSELATGSASVPRAEPRLPAEARDEEAPTAPTEAPAAQAKGPPLAAKAPAAQAGTARDVTPHIVLDENESSAAGPFQIVWEGLPAVSRDGKTIAVVLDVGLIQQKLIFQLLDGTSGATKRTIALVSGKAAEIYSAGDSEPDARVTAAVLASTKDHVREMHHILQQGGYTGLPRVEVSLKPVTAALEKALDSDTGALPMPALRGIVGTTTVTLDNDRLSIDRAGQLVERRVPQWRHAAYNLPWHVHCDYYAALGEIAVDEAHERVVLLVHQYVMHAGDICALPSRYRVVRLKPAH